MGKLKEYTFTLNLSKDEFEQLMKAIKKHRSFLNDDLWRYKNSDRETPKGEEKAFIDTKSLEKQIKTKTS